ncbi:MAG: hypothetical protein ABI693_21400 [Bryobacteraceae bacterium]
MNAFTEFLKDAAQRGEVVNLSFEERLFDLVGVLRLIADALARAGIPYEVIGGLAVLIHVEEVSPEHSSLTRDVDLLVRRSDLDHIKEIAAQRGFRFRQAGGDYILVYEGVESAKSAVHLVFDEANVRAEPQAKHIHGREVMVIPVTGLLQMKLTSFRLKDQVHIKSLDAAGLITPEVEASLTPELLARLTRVRLTE